MKEEKWHHALNELGIPAGPGDDWHHTIMEGLGVVELTITRPKDCLDFGSDSRPDPCSSEAEKLARQLADCQVTAVERLIALGLGRQRPDLTGRPVDPRTIYPDPNSVPPGAVSSCHELSGGAPPPRDRGCELVHCAEPEACRCAGVDSSSPFVSGGTVDAPTDCASVIGRTAAFPCAVDAERPAARPSLCFAIRCDTNDVLDPVTCTCQPSGVVPSRMPGSPVDRPLPSRQPGRIR